jgi:hypothetical protein
MSVRSYTDSLSTSGAVMQMSNEKYRLLPAPISRYTLAAARRVIVSPNYSTCAMWWGHARLQSRRVRSPESGNFFNSTIHYTDGPGGYLSRRFQ